MSSAQKRLLNPFPWYHQMRANRPVDRHEADDAWSVFRYHDVQRVLSDYECFSSQAMGSGGNEPLDASIISIDPPRHKQLRSLVTQAFTPRTIAQLTPRITTIVHELLDRVASRGSMDIVADLASPLPVIVIAELLGIPTADLERFKCWSDAMAGKIEDEYKTAEKEMGRYFTHLLEQRKRNPKDDLLSALLAAEVDGQKLSLEELLGFCIILLVAGNITTTNLIGNAFLCFDEYPHALAQLYTDRSLLPNAVEEVLRYRSPAQQMYRLCRKETELGGRVIPEGHLLTAWIGSANRDESEFPNAGIFDITRSPNRQIAFGYGIHYCPGAPLARLEARITLGAMLERFSQMRRVRDVPLEPVTSDLLHGVTHLPITFSR